MQSDADLIISDLIRSIEHKLRNKRNEDLAHHNIWKKNNKYITAHVSRYSNRNDDKLSSATEHSTKKSASETKRDQYINDDIVNPDFDPDKKIKSERNSSTDMSNN